MEASALQGNTGIMRAPSAAPVLLRLRSDEQLVALFRAGNEEAFSVIHDRFQTRLLAYVRRMLPPGPRANAEDILQDVYLRAYSALRADERPVALRAWLYRVAHNRCIDELRRPGPQPTEIVEQEGDPRLDPALAAERREHLRRLVVDLGRLPEQQRSALLMRELEGFTYQELGDTLGVTQPAVKSLLVRARVGLAEASQARDTSCGEIREDLADTRDRRVRSSARAKRHLRDCGDCRGFDKALRSTTRDLGQLLPGPGLFAMLLGLVGGGGAGGGATAGGAVGGGAAGAASGGVAAATATKVAVAVCCVAATAGGAAVKVEHVLRQPAPVTAPAIATPASTHATAGGPASPVLTTETPATIPAAAAPLPADTSTSSGLPAGETETVATDNPATATGDSADGAATSGGTASPDDAAPASEGITQESTAQATPTTATTPATTAESRTPAGVAKPTTTAQPATTATVATATASS